MQSLSPPSVSRPSYSMRLVRPFLRVIGRQPGLPAGFLDPLYALDPDDRLPIATVHELLRGALEITHDEDLGLEAARELEVGEFGVAEYVAMSADSVRAAVEVIGRYMKLLNDALDFQLDVQGDRAIVKLQSAVVLPRAAETFEAACFHVAVRKRFDAKTMPGGTVCFQHAQPADLSEYAKTFDDVQVLFSQPYTGFTFDRASLDIVLPSRDQHLHELMRRHADHALSELPKVQSFVERVRALIAEELKLGNATSTRIADRLHVSVRTLSRRLEEEGTTFRDLLNEVRKHLALRYAATTDMQLTEIALLLGFSSAAVFHRSFKRWTGKTPLEYRQARRG